ncbi:MAG: hypothetical protein M3033_05910 [Acidobacteriota bacterium]|nr:hypothetical protein [Acidobacteriota bacterium]
MKKNFVQTLLLIIGFICLSQTVLSQNTAAPSARAESEKAIRAALYEISVATQSGDAKTFKRYAAQRTLKFYDLLVVELMKNPKLKEQLGQVKVTNGDNFIDFSFRSVAQRASATPRSKIEEFAREYQKSPLTFVSDTEAKVETKAGMLKMVREADEWKVDGTDGLKKVLLASLPLSAESKEKLEKF